MLTDNEKQWLEKRQNLCTRCSRAEYCRVGKKHNFNTHECRYWESAYLHYHDFYQDAASFEAQVALYMARVRPTELFACDGGELKTWAQMCPVCRLKHARIAVE